MILSIDRPHLDDMYAILLSELLPLSNSGPVVLMVGGNPNHDAFGFRYWAS